MLKSQRTMRVFSSDDFGRWMDDVARQLFGVTGEEFLSAYHAGKFSGSMLATYVASVEPLLNQPHSGSVTRGGNAMEGGEAPQEHVLA